MQVTIYVNEATFETLSKFKPCDLTTSQYMAKVLLERAEEWKVWDKKVNYRGKK